MIQLLNQGRDRGKMRGSPLPGQAGPSALRCRRAGHLCPAAVAPPAPCRLWPASCSPWLPCPAGRTPSASEPAQTGAAAAAEPGAGGWPVRSCCGLCARLLGIGVLRVHCWLVAQRLAPPPVHTRHVQCDSQALVKVVCGALNPQMQSMFGSSCRMDCGIATCKCWKAAFTGLVNPSTVLAYRQANIASQRRAAHQKAGDPGVLQAVC